MRARLVIGAAPLLGVTLAGSVSAQETATPPTSAVDVGVGGVGVGGVEVGAAAATRPIVIDRQVTTDPVLRGLYAKAGWH